MSDRLPMIMDMKSNLIKTFSLFLLLPGYLIIVEYKIEFHFISWKQKYHTHRPIGSFFYIFGSRGFVQVFFFFFISKNALFSTDKKITTNHMPKKGVNNNEWYIRAGHRSASVESIEVIVNFGSCQCYARATVLYWILLSFFSKPIANHG